MKWNVLVVAEEKAFHAERYVAEVKEWAVVKYLSLTVLFESCHRRHTISAFDCWSASRKSFQYNTLKFYRLMTAMTSFHIY